MTNRRRITIITISIAAGTFLSYFIFRMRRGGELTQMDYITLIGNLIISLAVILGIGFMFLWRKNKNDL